MIIYSKSTIKLYRMSITYLFQLFMIYHYLLEIFYPVCDDIRGCTHIGSISTTFMKHHWVQWNTLLFFSINLFWSSTLSRTCLFSKLLFLSRYTWPHNTNVSVLSSESFSQIYSVLSNKTLFLTTFFPTFHTISLSCSTSVTMQEI